MGYPDCLTDGTLATNSQDTAAASNHNIRTETLTVENVKQNNRALVRLHERNLYTSKPYTEEGLRILLRGRFLYLRRVFGENLCTSVISKLYIFLNKWLNLREKDPMGRSMSLHRLPQHSHGCQRAALHLLMESMMPSFLEQV